MPNLITNDWTCDGIANAARDCPDGTLDCTGWFNIAPTDVTKCLPENISIDYENQIIKGITDEQMDLVRNQVFDGNWWVPALINLIQKWKIDWFYCNAIPKRIYSLNVDSLASSDTIETPIAFAVGNESAEFKYPKTVKIDDCNPNHNFAEVQIETYTSIGDVSIPTGEGHTYAITTTNGVGGVTSNATQSADEDIKADSKVHISKRLLLPIVNCEVDVSLRVNITESNTGGLDPAGTINRWDVRQDISIITTGLYR